MQIIPLDQLRTDGGTQSRAAIDPVVVTEYAEAIAAGSVLPQPVAFFDGDTYWLADGFHRLAAHKQAGYPNVSTDVRQGDRRDAILYSLSANAAHGLRRTPADKRRAVETLLRDETWGAWSDREIARRCAVDGKTVAAVRSELNCGNPQMTERTVERGGTTYTMAVPQRSRQEEDPASVLTPAHDDWTPDEAPAVRRNDPAQLGALLGRSSVAIAEELPAKVEPPAEAPVRDGDEWFTPAKFATSAEKVMGGIDLDPASCEAANTIVRADAFYDQEADGLAQPWYGRVFLNPPYSETGAWIDKLAGEVGGLVTDVVVLVNAKVEAGWFEKLWELSPVICFVRGRISFVAGDGGKSQTGFYGQAFAYYGPNRAAFIEEFRQYGKLCTVLGA